MPHIALPDGVPGIRGLFEFRPETAKPLCKLANALLHAPNTLTPGERELIAAAFCMHNRDVDGLATLLPENPSVYRDRAGMIARHGYVRAGLPSAE